jgi:hypothetical protein
MSYAYTPDGYARAVLTLGNSCLTQCVHLPVAAGHALILGYCLLPVVAWL